MASCLPDFASTQEDTNYARLCRLLVDVGCTVLRHTFDNKHPPANLHVVLSSPSVFSTLQSLRRRRVLNPLQWGKLFPAVTSNVSSANFDVTLLVVLLRNICGLSPPVSTGSWDELPPDSDNSTEANIVRIKWYRNDVYGHATKASVDDATFNVLWQKISSAVLALGSGYGAVISRLKTESLDPAAEAHLYQQLLSDWKKDDDVIKQMLERTHGELGKIEEMVKQLQPWKRSTKESLRDKQDPFDLVKYISIIRQLYKDREGWLAPFPWCEEFQFSLDNIFTRLKFVSRRKERGVKTDDIVDMFQIFQPHQECSQPKRVLIEGQPGMGKTAYCHKIAYDWAKKRKGGETFPDVTLVLLLKCRDINCGLWEAIDDQLLSREVNEEEKERFFTFIRDHQSKVLLVLDGLDELPWDQLSIYTDIIRGSVLPECYIVVTARHEVGVKVRECCHTLLEVEGFTETDAKNFILRYFKEEHLAKKLLGELDSDVNLQDLTRNPLNTSLLCLVCEDFGGKFPASRTLLYLEIVECVLRRYRLKMKLPETNQDLVALYQVELKELGRIAMVGLQNGSMYFDESAFRGFPRHIISGLGFLSVEPGRSKRRPVLIYGFLHKIFQEFFAAFCHCCQLLDEKISVDSLIADFRYFQEFQQVLIFTSGMLARKSEAAVKVFISGIATQVNLDNRRLDITLACINECKGVGNTFDKEMALFFGSQLFAQGLDESVSFKPGALSQDDVLGIAHELSSSWKIVGRVLNVPDAVIDQIQANESTVSEKCYSVLRYWQGRYPSDATYHRLARALQHPTVDRVDVAFMYCGPQFGRKVEGAKDEAASVPAEIRARGPEAKRAFQKAMKSGKVRVYRGRIMLLGQDRAGKTSLKKSLLGLPFDPEEESTVGVEVDRSKCELEVDEVQNWMPSKRKKRERSEFEEELARLIVMDLRETKADDNGSTATDPKLQEVKGSHSEKKDYEKPKLLSNVDEPVTDAEKKSMIVENGQRAFSEQKPVDKSDTNELQLNINSTTLPNDVTDLIANDVTDLVVRYLQSLQLEDDIKSEEVTLTLWDFAGQHLYYASHSVFLSRRAVYILVYNLNKNLLATAKPCVRQGVNNIKLDNANNETNLDNLLSWLVSVHNIRSAAKEKVAHQGKKLSYLQPPVIIVGTNLDQPFEEVNTMEQRIKESLEYKEYERHVTAPFFAVDNKTENDEGVQKLRQRIIEILKNEPYMGEEVPLRWFKFERAVDALVAKQTYFMDLDQLLSVIRHVCQIEDKRQVTAMLNFYHDLGVIIKHGRTVVLQAQWLIKLFKQVIIVPPFDEADPFYRKCWKDLEVNGILRIALVDHVFSKFIDKGLCKQDILDMMELHGLIAKFSIATDENQDEQNIGEQIYFVPTQLRSSPSALCEIKPSGCDPSPLVIHFLDGFVPHGLFPQFVSKFIHWCSENRLKETPQLYNNGARLFIGKQVIFALILICRKRFIKIVLKTRNPSSCKSQSMDASNKMAIEVRNFIERTLDGFSRDLSWLSNLRYELSVVCTYCLKSTRDLHKKTSCDQDDCLHLLRVRPGEELICLENFCDETVSPGWEMWFEVPDTQTNEPGEDTQIAVGTSSEPETTTQRVKATKRKRNKNFTGTSSEPETTAQVLEAKKRKRNKNFTGIQGDGLKFATR
ncbi:PREDICTED: uncharacterized protein LOC107353578 isoform X3 [Acropora digitifera]|uniref:uncharacterized protein LOC107353578 isoform X3 n=1 Tax=Acropora digitifera TaxID=70779 RepID=UPI00077AA41B|nr:PREDICTED: uncharacterized protein LOC107353578 isoform X3 [Acropora digitifera]